MDPEDATLRFPRLRRRLRKLALCFAGVVVLGAIAFLVHRIVVAQRWKRFECELAELNAALPTTAPGRVTLLEPRTPGNAWDGYLAALNLMSVGSAPGDEVASAYLKGAVGPKDVELVRIWLEQKRPALDILFAAARCEQAEAGARVPKGNEVYRVLSRGWKLHWAARVDAWMSLRRGDRAGFTLRLAAIAQFALDLSRVPRDACSGAGAMMIEDQLQQAAALVGDPGATPQELMEIAGLWESIERNLPTSSQICALALAGEGRELRSVSADAYPWYRMQQHVGIRLPYRPLVTRLVFVACGFSIRSAIVDRWDADQRRRAHVNDAETASYGAVCAALNQDHELRRYSLNPLLHQDRYPIPPEFLTRRVRARSSLLRAAVQLRLGQAPLGPDWPTDPFSLKPIGYRTVGKRIVLWSEADYGDQGGIGEWEEVWGRCDLVLLMDLP